MFSIPGNYGISKIAQCTKIDLNDFGYEAEKYAGWLKENANDLRILQYGFSIYKKEIKFKKWLC